MGSQTAATGRAERRVGLAVFAVGMALLAAVFALAIKTFHQLPRLASGGAPAGIAAALAVAAVQAGLLLVMAYVSSLLASKGLELYSSVPPSASAGEKQ